MNVDQSERKCALLAEDANWEEIASWCGGELINHEDITGEYETELRINRGTRRPLSAFVNDLLMQLPSGQFLVYRARNDPDDIAWWKQQEDIARLAEIAESQAKGAEDPWTGRHERDDLVTHEATTIDYRVDCIVSTEAPVDIPGTDIRITYRGKSVPLLVDRIGDNDVILQHFVLFPWGLLIMSLPHWWGFYGGVNLVEWCVSIIYTMEINGSEAVVRVEPFGSRLRGLQWDEEDSTPSGPSSDSHTES